MKRIFSLVALGALSACTVAAQTTASKPTNAPTSAQGSSTTASSGTSAKVSSANPKKGTSSVTIAEGTKIDATLVSWLDARRSRVGDPVQARIEQDVKQGGKVVLKKGTELGGRVTVAQSRGSQGQSQVGIAFERALLPNGQSIPFHASIVALMAPRSASPTGASANNAVAAGSAMGATPASASSAAAMNTSNAVASGAAGGATSSGRLSSDSKGVFGLQGLSLGSAKSGTPGSTVASTTKNVRLNSGTEMLLRTSTQAR